MNKILIKPKIIYNCNDEVNEMLSKRPKVLRIKANRTGD